MLTIYDKTVYLIIFKAVMNPRALGESFPSHGRAERVKRFRALVFTEIEHLCSRMQYESLQTSDIRKSIEHVSSASGISFGQAQKAINILMKYHYFLHDAVSGAGAELDCPLDNVVLRELGERISLSKMDRQRYVEIQEKIAGVTARRIDFDRRWDEQHLRGEGLLGPG